MNEECRVRQGKVMKKKMVGVAVVSIFIETKPKDTVGCEEGFRVRDYTLG